MSSVRYVTDGHFRNTLPTNPCVCYGKQSIQMASTGDTATEWRTEVCFFPSPKNVLFPLQTKWGVLFCSVQSLACPRGTRHSPSFSLSLPIPGKTIHYCLKISSTKNPTYSQHTKMNTIPTKRTKGQPARHKWLGEQHISAPKCSSSGQTLPSKWQNRRQGKAKPKCHLFDSIGLQYLSVTVTI